MPALVISVAVAVAVGGQEVLDHGAVLLVLLYAHWRGVLGHGLPAHDLVLDHPRPPVDALHCQLPHVGPRVRCHRRGQVPTVGPVAEGRRRVRQVCFPRALVGGRGGCCEHGGGRGGLEQQGLLLPDFLRRVADVRVVVGTEVDDGLLDLLRRGPLARDKPVHAPPDTAHAQDGEDEGQDQRQLPRAVILFHVRRWCGQRPVLVPDPPRAEGPRVSVWALGPAVHAVASPPVEVRVAEAMPRARDEVVAVCEALLAIVIVLARASVHATLPMAAAESRQAGVRDAVAAAAREVVAATHHAPVHDHSAQRPPVAPCNDLHD
mmetsp:Transcript_4016/g.9490  ORF Transcript_4016/g.9490 Transcript_4016/m.9490 type:complete len:320 (-) Transcript_4016:1658-2617(-)